MTGGPQAPGVDFKLKYVLARVSGGWCSDSEQQLREVP
jgi:hypothetical protein